MALPTTPETVVSEADKFAELSDIKDSLTNTMQIVLDRGREDRDPLELPPRLEMEALPDIFIEAERLLDMFGFDRKFLRSLILRAPRPGSFVWAGEQIGSAVSHIQEYMATMPGETSDPSKIVSESVPLLYGVGQWLAEGFGMDMQYGTAVAWRRKERGLLDNSGQSV